MKVNYFADKIMCKVLKNINDGVIYLTNHDNNKYICITNDDGDIYACYNLWS